MKEEINQNYGTYYPPELDENLHEKGCYFSQKSQKSQNFAEILAQNGLKNEKTQNFEQIEKISKLLTGEKNPLSKILSSGGDNLSQVLSTLSKKDAKMPTNQIRPTYEEL